MKADAKAISEIKQDLLKSGIPSDLRVKLGIVPMSLEEVEKFTRPAKGEKGYGTRGYKIPYFDHNGKVINYARIKNLREKRRFGKAMKRAKYFQKANSLPHLYIPNIIEWPKDKEGRITVKRLVITEGEKKAICACLRGIYCIALGGVNSYKAKSRDIDMLEEFKYFNFNGCTIEICFDSDLVDNPNVKHAMNGLQGMIEEKCSPENIVIVQLSAEQNPEGFGKVGLDDFLVQFAKNSQAQKAFNALPRTQSPRLSVFNRFNAELVMVEEHGKFYGLNNRKWYNERDLVQHRRADGMVPDPYVPGKQLPAIQMWMQNRHVPTTVVQKVVYEPKKPERFVACEKDKYQSYNVWRPSPVIPMKGNYKFWLEHLQYMMVTSEKYEWLLQWLAKPLQASNSVEAKLFSAVFLYSRMQGTGKNFIVEPVIEKIYGDAYQMITTHELDSPFNSWLRCKQFIMANEIYVSDRKDREHQMGILKNAITSPKITTNEKFEPRQTYANYANFFITANQSNALMIDQFDRRFFVAHGPEEKKSEDYYAEMHERAHHPSSIAAVMYYLMNGVDTSKFNPRGAALDTEEKNYAIQEGRDLVTHYVSLIVDKPREVFSNNGKLPDLDIFTAEEIYQAINTWASENKYPTITMSPHVIGRYLSGSSLCKKHFGGRSEVLGSHYAVFDRPKWEKADNTSWIKHIMRYNPKYKKDLAPIEGTPADKIVSITRARKHK